MENTKPKLFEFSITVEAEGLVEAEDMVESILIGRYEQTGSIIECLEVMEVDNESTKV